MPVFKNNIFFIANIYKGFKNIYLQNYITEFENVTNYTCKADLHIGKNTKFSRARLYYNLLLWSDSNMRIPRLLLARVLALASLAVSVPIRVTTQK